MEPLRETGRRVLMAGGGTGGHLYPGLAVAEALRELCPDAAVAFATTEKPIDRTVLEGHPYPATPLATRPFQKGPWTWPGLALSLARAGMQARRRLREFCPEVVVGLGGYGSYAPVRVAQKLGIATVILNPDIVPGRANQRLGGRADLVCCQFQETVGVFGRRGRRTGCPVRPSLFEPVRAEAIATYGLDPDRRTLLVTGASLGARSVNRAVVAMLRGAGLPEGWQMLHLAGKADYDVVRAAYDALDVKAAVLAFEPQMGLAYAAADVAVARAGASTVAELSAVGLPAVYLPYPHHRDQHQRRQAQAMERQGAAVVIDDRPGLPEATGHDLAEALAPMLRDERRLVAVRQRARSVGRPQAAREVAEAILELADRAVRARHEAVSARVDKGEPVA